MKISKFMEILSLGENVAVEFKLSSSGKILGSVYETVCSFSNRFGGDIFLGVNDAGVVVGINEKIVNDTINNFIKMVNNPEIIFPTLYLVTESFVYENKNLIHIHIPPSADVHSYKKVIYDRVNKSDVKVTRAEAIAQLYIRKQNMYTERKVFPYVRDDQLRFDLIPKIRQMAINNISGHPWGTLTDKELLKSAGLITIDSTTGEEGYNLAAVILLGKDDTIKSVLPSYRTDALVRKIDTERYDDRLIVETNLIDSYYILSNFASKHLRDKFYLDGTLRVSLRAKITREILVNMLIHREFTSPYRGIFVILNDYMFTENANKTNVYGLITPDDYTPVSKNPTIASFFRNIGLADELGSGVRNLYRDTIIYSGKYPELIEGDIFKTIIPLDNNYSFNARTTYNNQNSGMGKNEECKTIIANNKSVGEKEYLDKNVGESVGEKECLSSIKLSKNYYKIYECICENNFITISELSVATGIITRTIERCIQFLRENEIIKRIGGDNGGCWKIIKKCNIKS
ncbi:MAG: putative DNA binding domain-containing protein [Acholeplasmatales bacterium]|jgi:ATP-dependent DNA helicase RecG|nr:putative DNA binding domain-containing protein [Acholeplasmatales bacterium]